MTRRRRHRSSAMKVRGAGRAYKQRAWIRLFDGDWNCTASSRTIRRGGGRLPYPEEIGLVSASVSVEDGGIEMVMSNPRRALLGGSKFSMSFPHAGGGGSSRFGGGLS